MPQLAQLLIELIDSWASVCEVPERKFCHEQTHEQTPFDAIEQRIASHLLVHCLLQVVRRLVD